MEMEQIIKRLEWLDNERRKDKMTIATLEERLLALEGGIPAIQQQIRDLNGEVSRLASLLGRMDQLDTSIAQVRVEVNRTIESIEKQRTEHERETEKIRRVEMEGISKAIADVRKGLEPIPDLRKGLEARTQEDFRLARLVEEVEKRVLDSRHSDEEYKRSLKLLEEGRRQDAKRLTDLQGEITAYRKRVEEQRGKVDLTSDGLRKLEVRLSEVLSGENERKAALTNFTEKQALVQVERDRVWKEWLVRFDQIEKQSSGLDSQVQNLDALQRSVKKSQDTLDDVSQRLERRNNEITEIQRLGEDRFRQDWTAFKGDDQKRWTNYTLAQEEQQREVSRQFDKLNDRITYYDDSLDEIQERLAEINDETAKRLQGMLTLAHEWMTAYERAFGRPKA
jgi:uncharacterized phage infection (PIP) family protein YhgE